MIDEIVKLKALKCQIDEVDQRQEILNKKMNSVIDEAVMACEILLNRERSLKRLIGVEEDEL